MLSLLGLKDKAKEGPLTLPTVQGLRREKEGQGAPQSCQPSTANSWKWAQLSVWNTLLCHFPRSLWLFSFRSSVQSQWLPLLSQGSCTNKTCRENPHFSKPAHPQNCSVFHLLEGGGTGSVLKSKSSSSSLQQWHNPNETACSTPQYPGAPGSKAWCQLPALVQVFCSCIYHFIIASSL